MSRAMGSVHVDGKVVGYYCYNGTTDVAHGDIFDTRDECFDNWGSYGRKCTCAGQGRPVILHSEYGGGFWWHAMACLKCKVITAGRAPFDTEGIEIENGLPPIEAEIIGGV